MKRVILLLIFFAPALLFGQGNLLLTPEFWKSGPSLDDVKANIAKGNSASEANRGNFDVVTIAINNNASFENIKYLISQEGNSINKKTHDGRIYLHWAASRGNVELVNYLLEQGSDINFGDDRGTIPMAFALAGGQSNPAIYEAFFKAGNNPKQTFQNGAGLLLLGISNDKDLSLSNYLVSKGLSYNDKDALGRTAFDYAARSGNLELLKKLQAKGVKATPAAVIFAAQGGRGTSTPVEVYQYLVDDLKITANAASENGENALHFLVRKPDQDKAIAYFLGKGVDINQPDNKGNSAFYNAAGTRNTALAKNLLPKVKNVNAVNKKGETALMAAVENGSPDMVDLLIKNGAKVNISSAEGNLGYYLVQSYRAPRPGEAADEFTKKMLVLQEAGLDLKSPQPNGNTLYHLAVPKNDLVLFTHLEKLNIDVNVKNKEGMTALHRAALMAKDDAVLKFLMNKGAKKDITTEFDETAYDLAKENEYLAEHKIAIDFLK